jgi:hypothetical protein
MQLIRQSAIVKTKGQLLVALHMAEDFPGDTKILLIHKDGESLMTIYGGNKEEIAQVRRRVRKIPTKQLF